MSTFFDISDEYIKEHGTYKQKYDRGISNISCASSIRYPSAVAWDDDVAKAILEAARTLIDAANKKTAEAIERAKANWDFDGLEQIKKEIEKSKNIK